MRAAAARHQHRRACCEGSAAHCGARLSRWPPWVRWHRVGHALNATLRQLRPHMVVPETGPSLEAFRSTRSRSGAGSSARPLAP